MAKPKSDRGHQLTDQMLTDLEKRLHDEYEKAAKEIQLKLDDYMKRFRTKDKIWQKWVDKGVKTQEEYQEWRIGQLAMGERWEKMKDRIVSDQTNANRIARQITNREMPSIFALNANYAIYQAEHDARIDTSLTLYNREAVDRILREDPDLLLPPGKKVSQQIKTKKAVRWEKQKIQSVMMQGIMQGESIPTIAARLSQEVEMMDFKAAVRNARTMATNAQNAGRYDAYERLQNNGVDLTLEWAATLDDRTRHEHRLMHGQRRDVGEPFVVDGIEIMYPAQTGDFMGVRESDIPQSLIWNCRCTILAWVKGFEHDTIKESDKMGDMTFDEWLEAKENPQDILHQHETGKDIRDDYIRRYGGSNTGSERMPEEQPEKVFEFTPAKTLAEAEEYISNYVDKDRFGAIGVNYKGVSVDVANEINKTIGRFYETFDVEKLGGIIAPAGNTKYGKMIENATAAYSDIRRSFFLNRKSLKTIDTAREAFAKEYNAIKGILEHPENYDLSRLSTKVRKLIENSKESGRGTIPQTIEEAINHELGHSLEKQISKHELYDTVLKNMPKYNKGLSGYACQDKSEYIAESFCSYMKKEGKVDPDLVTIFKSIMRK